MSKANPKPLTADEVATTIREQFKILKNSTAQDDKNVAIYAISVLTDLYVKITATQ
jgi:hypothetical protein